MFVWTKKAEEAYRAKYPHRKNERKAGTMIMWEGKELHDGSILQGYYSRGWVEEAKKSEPKVKLKRTHKYHSMPDSEKRKRWYKLIFFFNQPNKLTLDYISKGMGYHSHNVISDFVKNYGEEMVAKYGKLPYREELRSLFWKNVMEMKSE